MASERLSGELEQLTGREPTSKNAKALRVPVLAKQEAQIKENAKKVGLSVAAYLRDLGLGYEPSGILDQEAVRELAKVNADQGRLGGLLKRWLVDDEKLVVTGDATELRARINELFQQLQQLQQALQAVMARVVGE